MKEHSPQIVTIGSATIDIFISYKKQWDTANSPLLQGNKIEVESIEYATGGGAINSAVSFARQGFSVIPIAQIGPDHEGTLIKQSLTKEQVSDQYLQCSTDKKTGISFIIPQEKGERTALVYRGANNYLKITPELLHTLSPSHAIYISSLAGASAHLLPFLVYEARNLKKVLITVNPGTRQLTTQIDTLINALSHIDILIMNAYEGSLLAGTLINRKIISFTPTTFQHPTTPSLLREGLQINNQSLNLIYFFNALLQLGPRYIALTNGAEGVYVAHQTRIVYAPSLARSVISSIGAGDAFGSCFVGSLVQGNSLEQAIIKGMKNSASVISYVNAQKGLLTRHQLVESDISSSLLQFFSLIE